MSATYVAVSTNWLSDISLRYVTQCAGRSETD